MKLEVNKQVPVEEGTKVSQEKVKKKETSKAKEKSLLPPSKDTEYSYCYILSTAEQRKALDLTKHKVKLEKTIKEYFAEQLVSLKIYKDHYHLVLNETYTVAQKRRLGRLISEKCDLQSYVYKVSYNNDKDSSGQLFRICKETDNISTLK